MISNTKYPKNKLLQKRNRTQAPSGSLDAKDSVERVDEKANPRMAASKNPRTEKQDLKTTAVPQMPAMPSMPMMQPQFGQFGAMPQMPT